MKSSPRLLCVVTVLFLFFATHNVYGFKNPYRTLFGEVVKIKELSDHSFLVVFQNSDSGYHQLCHVSAGGDILAVAALVRSNRQYHFSTLYEHNGEYALSMNYVEADSADTIMYQEFRFFDASLNLLRVIKHNVDEPAQNILLFNDMSSTLTWAAMIRRDQDIYLKTIQFGINGAKKLEQVHLLSGFTSPSSFVKVVPQKTGSAVFAMNDSLLIRFDLDSSLNLTDQHSFSNTFKTDASGPLRRYDFVEDIIAINDSQFVAVFGDRTKYKDPGNNMYEVNLAKIQGNTIISCNPIGEQHVISSFFLSLLKANYLKYDKMRREIYVLYLYDIEFQSPGDFIALKFSEQMDTLNRLMFRPSAHQDTVRLLSTFEILESGTCVFGGRTKTGRGFMGLVDTSGLISGIAQRGGMQEIAIFPNPGNNRIGGLPQTGTIELYSIVGGRAVFTIQNTEANVAELSTGVYFYRIINEHKEVIGSGKWIKE